MEKLKKQAVETLVDYFPNAVVSKTIIKKTTGDVIIYSIGEGEHLPEKFIPFDTYIQVIEGTATFVINNTKCLIKQGECIIIPAHIKHHVAAGAQFKMMCTIIKSGYEE